VSLGLRMTTRQNGPLPELQPPAPAYGPHRHQFDFSTYFQDLTTLARHCLAAAGPAAAARAIQDRAEAVLAAYPEEVSLIACAAGCSHCCIMNVAVLAPEVAAIADYLKTAVASARLATIRLRIETLVAASRNLTEEERLALHHACAFVDERGYCEIHPVRPLLCRRANSVDAKDCMRALEMQEGGMQVPIVADLFHERLFEQAFLALARALDEAGTDSASGRLSEEVLRYLQDADEPG
jgi:Fe-S-cluster containining protein